jgi:hypothetical protein
MPPRTARLALIEPRAGPAENSGVVLLSFAAATPWPNELFGKFTRKIENFSEISKRELRSNVFDVGGYKW